MARPRDPSLDRKIIDGCLELLAEEGRAGLTRERIAARAGVSLPAVTRRYADVDEILLAIARTPYHETVELAEADTLRDYLTASLRRTAETLADDPTIARSAIELLAAGAGNVDIASELHASIARHREQGLRLVEEAKATGEVDADLDGEVLLDLVNGLAYYRLLWRGETLAVDGVEGVVDLLLRGVMPRG